MSKKKKSNYYAVKVGRNPGIYTSWDECKAQVEGFSGCKYKGFQTKEEAVRYLNEDTILNSNNDIQSRDADIVIFVDGSYDNSTGVYGYGCVAIHKNGEIRKFNGAGNNPESAKLRNVTGEMLGAMQAVRYAMKNHCSSVEICYDYYGIEMWVTGEWAAEANLTSKYAEAMKEWGKSIDISFRKVAAHTNVEYNEIADQLAKQAVKTFGNK